MPMIWRFPRREEQDCENTFQKCGEKSIDKKRCYSQSRLPFAKDAGYVIGERLAGLTRSRILSRSERVIVRLHGCSHPSRASCFEGAPISPKTPR